MGEADRGSTAVPSSALRRLAARPSTQAFLASFALALAVGLIQGQKPFFFDSGAYWSFSESFVNAGRFSLFNFGDPIRGYALPLALFGVRNVGEAVGASPWVIVVTFNAALFSLIGAVLLPRVAAITWPRLSWGVLRRVALFCLILAFWRGYLSYPLSDFPALAAGLLAIVAVASPTSPGWMLVGGASAALALEIRPAYILFVLALPILILWSWRLEEGALDWRRRALCLGLFVAAAAAVALPQSLVEHHRTAGYSPLPGGNRLTSIQYTAGLGLQRFDGFVGGELAPMSYVDPHTEDLVDELGGTVTSTGQYVEVVLRHPLTMAGVFARHAVNGLDQRYSTPYVERIHPPGQWAWRLAGFLIVFLALVRVAWNRSRRNLGPAQWRYPAVFLLTSATSIASAVEQRFLLPVFVICATLVLAPGWVSPLREGKGIRRYRDLAVIVIAGAILLVVAAKIVNGASDNLRLGLVE